MLVRRDRLPRPSFAVAALPPAPRAASAPDSKEHRSAWRPPTPCARRPGPAAPGSDRRFQNHATHLLDHDRTATPHPDEQTQLTDVLASCPELQAVAGHVCCLVLSATVATAYPTGCSGCSGCKLPALLVTAPKHPARTTKKRDLTSGFTAVAGRVSVRVSGGPCLAAKEPHTRSSGADRDATGRPPTHTLTDSSPVARRSAAMPIRVHRRHRHCGPAPTTATRS